jgi:hypothetical protein
MGQRSATAFKRRQLVICRIARQCVTIVKLAARQARQQ